jgi:hypothetical protein
MFIVYFENGETELYLIKSKTTLDAWKSFFQAKDINNNLLHKKNTTKEKLFCDINLIFEYNEIKNKIIFNFDIINETKTLVALDNFFKKYFNGIRKNEWTIKEFDENFIYLQQIIIESRINIGKNSFGIYDIGEEKITEKNTIFIRYTLERKYQSVFKTNIFVLKKNNVLYDHNHSFNSCDEPFFTYEDQLFYKIIENTIDKIEILYVEKENILN